MNPTQNDIGKKILKRFAKLLLRCPFHEELFDSIDGLTPLHSPRKNCVAKTSAWQRW